MELEQRRRLAVQMVRDGATQQEAADYVGATQPAVSFWMKREREGGHEALAARPTTGRPCALSDEQKQELVALLLERPTQLGFSTDLWTLPRIRQLIGERFGVWYHHDHLSRLMRNLGYSWQKPVKRAVERDEQAIEQWIRRDWPRIKKKAARRAAHIVFIDESGYSMIPSICKTWAPIGCTPVARHRARHWRKVSVIGALSISPKRHRLGCYLATHCDRAIRQPQIIDFLRHLMRHLRGAIIIVWDNLNAHRGRQLRDWLAKHPRLDVEYLPPYAPELNPVEGMWNHGKNHYLANHCIDDVFELADRIHTHAAHLGTSPNLLRGFLRQTKLPLRPHRRTMNYQRSA